MREARTRLERAGFTFSIEGCLGIYGRNEHGTFVLVRWDGEVEWLRRTSPGVLTPIKANAR